MLTPSVDAFAALARSSPWRWSTLRFTVRRGVGGDRVDPVRAWLRRPDRLRVETVGGALVQVVREAGPAVAVLDPDGGSPVAPSWSDDPEPLLRPDGLVALWRGDRCGSYDAPMFEDYRWVAFLDPVELADGIDRATDARVPALVVDSVTEVEHAGRPAWEAVVRTTPAYEPRCGCCPLLRSREVDLLEYGDDPRWLPPTYPEAHRVRLDVGTGVCVQTEEIGGHTAGRGHHLRIEAVDEPMGDDLFVEPRWRLLRTTPPGPGWAPAPQ